jgi:hypothetical protein
MVTGVVCWRGDGGWVQADIAIPEDVARRCATKVYEPDLLGMVLARAADVLERVAR